MVTANGKVVVDPGLSGLVPLGGLKGQSWYESIGEILSWADHFFTRMLAASHGGPYTTERSACQVHPSIVVTDRANNRFGSCWSINIP